MLLGLPLGIARFKSERERHTFAFSLVFPTLSEAPSSRTRSSGVTYGTGVRDSRGNPSSIWHLCLAPLIISRCCIRVDSRKCRTDFGMTDSKNDKTKVDLGLLEEDDEFEEFPAEDWTAVDEDNEDISVWEDNWDDDDVEDDFNQQLRAQLEKQKGQNDQGKEN